MTNNEAKFILSAYRPNGRDADNPVFQEALQQARNDPALTAWFAREQAHDAAIGAKLAQVAPPAGLREAILAGGRASGAARWPWRTPALWFALAASLAVALWFGVGKGTNRSAVEVARFAAFAARDTAHEKHGGHGPAAGELAAVLSSSTTHLANGLAVDISSLRANGCRTVSFAGHDVLEVCFQRDGAWFHCYIANRADFPGLPAKATALFAQQAGLATASWSDSAHHFVLVGEAGLDAVKRIL